MDLGKVSIIISACNEGDNLPDMVGCILDNTTYPNIEVVVVDDGSSDGSGDRVAERFGNNPQVSLQQSERVGVARGRNLGAEVATGDLFVFLDGHCYLPPGWLVVLIAPLANSAVGMVGPAITSLSTGGGPDAAGMTWRDASLQPHWIPHQSSSSTYPVPLLPGGCQVVRRTEFEQFGGYDAGMIHWGSESEELSLRYWLMGYQVVAQPKALIYHLFREKSPYELAIADVIYNRLRLAALHFTPERRDRVFAQLQATTADFEAIKQSLAESDVDDRREQFRAMRRYDDDWFCTQFGCPI